MSERADSEARGNGRRILLVEDELGFQDLLRLFLENLGYVVEAVADGDAAMHCLRTQLFDVVITDLCMPGFDGMQLLARLRQQKFSIPIIAMSGGVGGEMAAMLRAAELLGASQSLTKPFPLSDLGDALGNVFGER